MIRASSLSAWLKAQAAKGLLEPAPYTASIRLWALHEVVRLLGCNFADQVAAASSTRADAKTLDHYLVCPYTGRPAIHLHIVQGRLVSRTAFRQAAVRAEFRKRFIASLPPQERAQARRLARARYAQAQGKARPRRPEPPGSSQ